MKYYAVKNGRSTGVYDNWSDCESQVKGYPGNQYKSFSSRQAAEAYANGSNKEISSGSNHLARPSHSSRLSHGSSRSKKGPSLSPSSSSSSSYHPYRKPSKAASPSSIASITSITSYASHLPASSSQSASSSGSKIVHIYTDGASKNNQARKQGLSRAGYGVYYGPNDSRNYSGRVKGEQTNSRGELEGIRHALQTTLQEVKSGKTEKAIINTDSQYSIDSIGKWADNWERNGFRTSSGAPVANQDLIKSSRSLIRQIKENNGFVEFRKVKGHSGNYGNDMADRLAVEGCSKK